MRIVKKNREIVKKSYKLKENDNILIPKCSGGSYSKAKVISIYSNMFFAKSDNNTYEIYPDFDSLPSNLFNIVKYGDNECVSFKGKIYSSKNVKDEIYNEFYYHVESFDNVFYPPVVGDSFEKDDIEYIIGISKDGVIIADAKSPEIKKSTILHPNDKTAFDNVYGLERI